MSEGRPELDADHYFNVSKDLLDKLDLRDKEIMRLRNLLKEHGIDPFSPVKQIEIELKEIQTVFERAEKALDKLDQSSW